MNVFEDLIVELKQENLLESTVMDTVPGQLPADDAYEVQFDDHIDVFETDVIVDALPSNQNAVALAMPEDVDLQLLGNGETVEIRKPSSDREFFKKRAINEVSSLQMVEHVLTAIEREHMRIVPRVFDVYQAKVALNNFLRVSEDISSDEHKVTEFALMQETEAWCAALSLRDKNISVANLRRYCESCRPTLSSQAMLSLARFYRNLPYSEGVRGKFDFIITRLFSRPSERQRRVLLFTREEMLGHIKTLYADWSSLSLFTADEDKSNVTLTALSFDDLTAEAESATEFDELIMSDFFNRMRLFKESINELFYAQVVTGAAIAANIRIGNAYVELIDRERSKSNAASVHDRYSYIDDQTVSEATGRTLELVDLLREKAMEVVVVDHEVEKAVKEVDAVEEPVAKPDVRTKIPTSVPRIASFGFFGINKWLLVVGIIMVLASGGLYVWANFFVVEQASTEGVKGYDLADSPFRDDVKVAKISGETFYGIMKPAWETMTKEKQQDVLQRIQQTGKTDGWTSVSLMNSTGKTVGYASLTRTELVGQ